MTQRILIQAVGTILLLVAAFFYGRSTGIDHQKAADLAVLQKGLRAAQRVQDSIGRISAAHARAENIREEKVREIYRDVPLVIDKPVYRNVCVDAGGVSLLDRAVDAANGGESGRGAAGEPAGVPQDAPKG